MQALIASHRAQPCLSGSKSVDDLVADAGWDIRVVASKYWKLRIDDETRRRVFMQAFSDDDVKITCQVQAP